MAKKTSRRRVIIPQPPIYTEIDQKATLELIKQDGAAFFFGDGKIDPNLDDSWLERLTGSRWLTRAANVANMSVVDNQDQWKGGLAETALDKAMNWWRNQLGKQQRRRPCIYKINTDAMRQQAGWAAANGAIF